MTRSASCRDRLGRRAAKRGSMAPSAESCPTLSGLRAPARPKPSSTSGAVSTTGSAPLSPRQNRETAKTSPSQSGLDSAGDAERAHVVALLPPGFSRGMMDGPTPPYRIEKPPPGASRDADGRRDHRHSYRPGRQRHDRELRPRGMAKARGREAPPDPLHPADRQPPRHAQQLGLRRSALLEGPHLGQSEMARPQICCLWIATGNTPEFSKETARRRVRIRLRASFQTATRLHSSM